MELKLSPLPAEPAVALMIRTNQSIRLESVMPIQLNAYELAKAVTVDETE